MTQPDVILCDEPSGSLDRANSEQVISLLRDAAKQTGATLVMSTHDRSAADQMDEILVIQDGRLTPLEVR